MCFCTDTIKRTMAGGSCPHFHKLVAWSKGRQNGIARGSTKRIERRILSKRPWRLSKTLGVSRGNTMRSRIQKPVERKPITNHSRPRGRENPDRNATWSQGMLPECSCYVERADTTTLEPAAAH